MSKPFISDMFCALLDPSQVSVTNAKFFVSVLKTVTRLPYSYSTSNSNNNLPFLIRELDGWGYLREFCSLQSPHACEAKAVNFSLGMVVYFFLLNISVLHTSIMLGFPTAPHLLLLNTNERIIRLRLTTLARANLMWCFQLPFLTLHHRWG